MDHCKNLFLHSKDLLTVQDLFPADIPIAGGDKLNDDYDIYEAFCLKCEINDHRVKGT